MDAIWVQHIVQAGAVGISIALIFLIWKITEYCNHNGDRIIEVVEKNAEAMTKLTDSINNNTDITEKMSDSLRSISEVARSAMHLKSKKTI